MVFYACGAGRAVQQPAVAPWVFGLRRPLSSLPFGLLIWYGIGFASVTTLSIGLMTILIFSVRAILGLGPWEYIIYGVVAEILMVWTLRPNIKRLMEGTERRHGLPAMLQQRKQTKGPKNNH